MSRIILSLTRPTCSESTVLGLTDDIERKAAHMLYNIRFSDHREFSIVGCQQVVRLRDAWRLPRRQQNCQTALTSADCSSAAAALQLHTRSRSIVNSETHDSRRYQRAAGRVSSYFRKLGLQLHQPKNFGSCPSQPRKEVSGEVHLAFCYVAPLLGSRPQSCRTQQYAVTEQISCNGRLQPACGTTLFLHRESFAQRCTTARLLLWDCKQRVPRLLLAICVELERVR